MNQTEQSKSRRAFLRRASLAALAFPFLINCSQSDALAQKSDGDILSLIKKNARPAGAEAMGAIDAPTNVSWKTILSSNNDDGEPMLISGTVFQADGKTPAPDVLIYLYHTDKYGIYGRGGEHKHGRFRGWLLTDRQGRYEFRSIRPSSYPNSTISAHVHMTVTGKNFREDWIDSILFEGDRFITARERSEAGKRGGFNPILSMQKGADGIWRGRRDIQLMS